jgi:DNA-binding GntR family transcriptional regulator
VEYNNEWFPDNVDLFASRSRDNFSLKISQRFNIEPKRIEKDLLMILDHLEKERIKRLSGEKELKEEMTEDEIKLGMEFLKNPDLFEQIIKDMEILGYVGEDLNKILMYLCATSRLMDDPISIMIISESASGKSYLVDTVRQLIPDEDTYATTSQSEQASNYIPDLLHKFYIFGEAEHSDIVEHQIRDMLSAKELSRLVVNKDEKTGEMITKLVKKKVIISAVITTTKKEINPENLSRFFVINADESIEQTERIQRAKNRKYTIEREIEKREKIPEIRKKHLTAQRLLKKIVIVNPFWEYLKYPSFLLRMRRDHERFIDLIAVICFLRQFQKEIKTHNMIQFIECDLTDYDLAREIMIKVILPATIMETSQIVIEIYERIRKYVQKIAVNERLQATDVTFIQREIREETKMNGDTIRKALKTLVDYEYIQVTTGKQRGTRFSYRLREDKEFKEFSGIDIPTVNEIKEMMEKNYKI